MTRLTKTASPTLSPVTVTQAKAQAVVEHDADDTLIDRLIAAATGMVEQKQNRTLVNTTYELALDDFPRGTGLIWIPRPPLQSIEAITYYDTAGTQQTLATTVYEAVTSDTDFGCVVLKPGQTWPAVQSDKVSAVTVEFIAGYGGSGATEVQSVAAVPEATKRAILMHVATLYEHREAVLVGASVVQVPMTADALAGVHALPRLG